MVASVAVAESLEAVVFLVVAVAKLVLAVVALAVVAQAAVADVAADAVAEWFLAELFPAVVLQWAAAVVVVLNTRLLRLAFTFHVAFSSRFLTK